MSKDFIEEDNYKEHDYVTYARQFDSYRWFKPILTAFLVLIFFAILYLLLLGATGAYDFIRTGGDLNGFTERLRDNAEGGYDSLDVFDLTGSLINLGSVALMIPALAMARGIVRDRSFSSYSSSRGGWSHTVFLKCFLLSLVICGGILCIYNFFINEPGAYNNQFTQGGLIALFILCPLQCMAEEYIFRGLVCQTFGSWFRLPILAIVLSSVAFAAMHPYNRIGQAAVLLSALGFNISAWIGHGLEVSSALHIVNNMLAFLFAGFGISDIKSDVSVDEMIVDALIAVLYVAAVFVISRKTDWFDRIKYDDAGDWNDIMDDKFRTKEARKAARRAKREARKNK